MSDSISDGYYLDQAIKTWNESKCPKSKDSKHKRSKNEPYGMWVCELCGYTVFSK